MKALVSILFCLALIWNPVAFATLSPDGETTESCGCACACKAAARSCCVASPSSPVSSRVPAAPPLRSSGLETDLLLSWLAPSEFLISAPPPAAPIPPSSTAFCRPVAPPLYEQLCRYLI